MRLRQLLIGPLAACALLPSALHADTRPAAPPDKREAKTDCTALKPGDLNRTLLVAGKSREYRLHVPPAGAGAPRPLVIVLHGGAGSGPNVQGFSQMDPVSDAKGFIVAYPSGPRGLVGGTWNAVDCCGLAMEKGSNDLEFISALIDEAVKTGCVDPKRVYATGISNGGMFAYHLACDLSDKIAAIAPISGALMDPTCTPKRPVSVLIYHGTADKNVPWKGGGDFKGAGAHHPFPSVDEDLHAWLKIDHCTDEHHGMYQKGDTTCVVYDHCAEGTAVGLCTIEGGGHTWPGGKPVMTWYLGKTTKDISNDVMWNFFAEHPIR